MEPKPKKKLRSILTKKDFEAIKAFNEKFPVLFEKIRDGRYDAADISRTVIHTNFTSTYRKLRHSITREEVDSDYLKDDTLKDFIDRMSSLFSIIMSIDKDLQKRIIEILD